MTWQKWMALYNTAIDVSRAFSWLARIRACEYQGCEQKRFSFLGSRKKIRSEKKRCSQNSGKLFSSRTQNVFFWIRMAARLKIHPKTFSGASRREFQKIPGFKKNEENKTSARAETLDVRKMKKTTSRIRVADVRKWRAENVIWDPFFLLKQETRL